MFDKSEHLLRMKCLVMELRGQFNNFINNLNDETECTTSKLVDDTELEGWLTCWMVELHFKGALRNCKTGRQKVHELKSTKVCTWDWLHPALATLLLQAGALIRWPSEVPSSQHSRDSKCSNNMCERRSDKPWICIPVLLVKKEFW